MRENQKSDHFLQNVRYMKTVTIGSINPNVPFSEVSREQQEKLLNHCLTGYPKGTIIGKDVAVGCFQMGEHTFTMEKTTYHIGFERKPEWLGRGEG